MTDKTISPEQVAVLAERVDTLLNHFHEFRGMVVAISTSQAVQLERSTANDAAMSRAFKTLEDHDKRLDAVAGEVKVHSWTWKLVGSFCLVAVSLTGWALSELRTLQRIDGEHEKRLTLQEFIVGGRAHAPAPRQPEVTSK